MIAEESIVSKALQTISEAKLAYCKFLSANDSGETGGHQAGILILKKALPMLFFDDEAKLSHIEKRTVKILWQDDIETNSVFTLYKSKNELRITSFGRGFPYLNKEDTGALFVLAQMEDEYYKAYFLNTEDDIEAFLETMGISPTETNRLITQATKSFGQSRQEFDLIQDFIKSITVNNEIVFPDSATMSRAARDIENSVYNHAYYVRVNPDRKIIDWTDQEFRLFRMIENFAYFTKINLGFTSMDSFVDLANQVLNRRKSRAGKSLEHHISAIFDGNNIAYEEQVRTEGNKKPDFIGRKA